MRAAVAALAVLAWVSGCDRGPEPQADVGALRAALDVPFFRNRLDAAVAETWRRRDLVFERIHFQGRYRDRIPALLCYSELALFRPRPAVLYMPGRPSRKSELLQPQGLMPRWADAGYVVMSIDRPYDGDRPGDLGAAIETKGLARVWGETVYDLMCAIDYLGTRAEVDTARIGMLGWSMGGMEALLVAALDRRIAAVASAGGHLAWDEIFAAGAWRLIFPGLPITRELVAAGADARAAQRAFQERFASLEYADAAVAARLIAPRPLLLLGGEADTYVPVAATDRAHAAAAVAYRILDAEERLRQWSAPGIGHQFTQAMEQHARAWFDRWLIESAT